MEHFSSFFSSEKVDRLVRERSVRKAGHVNMAYNLFQPEFIGLCTGSMACVCVCVRSCIRQKVGKVSAIAYRIVGEA